MPLTHTAALVTLSTPHFDRLVDFYQQLLNQAPVTLLPNVYAEFQLPGVRFGIFRPKAGERQKAEGREQEAMTPHSRSAERSRRSPLATPDSPPPTGMALCIEVTHLESAIAHLTELGFPPESTIITASHGREIYAYDPDGNWLILHQSHSQT